MASTIPAPPAVLYVGTAGELVSDSLAVERPRIDEVSLTTTESLTDARDILTGARFDGVVYDDRDATAPIDGALDRLRDSHRLVPVLVIAADPDSAAAALDAGATDAFVGREDGDGATLLAGRLRSLLRDTRGITDRLVDALDDVFYLIDATGDLVRWNEELKSVTGYSDAEVASMDPLEFFAGEDRAAVASAIAETRETGSATVEADMITKTGETIPYEYTGTRLTAPDGTIEGIVGIGRDITVLSERNRMLAMERDRLAAVFDATPYPFVHATIEDGHPIVEQINDDFADVFGYDQAALRGEPLDEYIVPDHDRGGSGEIVERLLAGETVERELVRETAAGEERHFQFKSTSITRADGTTEAIGAFVDITAKRERIQILDQLRKHASDVIWMSSVEKGSMDFISDSYADVWGRSPQSLREEPMSFLDAVHPEDRERVEDALAAQQEAPDEYDETYRVVQPDGEVRWVRDRAAGVYDGDDLTRIVGVATDITARRERERELEVKTRAMDEAPVGITIHDGDDPRTSIQYVNDGFTAVTGYDAAALDGEGLSLLAGPETDADRLERLERAFEDGSAASTVLLCYSEAGDPFWARISFAPVTDGVGDPTGFVGSIEDVTESKIHEQEIERRLAEFGDILAEDLRTPLRNAQSSVAEVAPTVDADLGTVEHSLRRIDQLIDDLTEVHSYSVKSHTITESLAGDGGEE